MKKHYLRIFFTLLFITCMCINVSADTFNPFKDNNIQYRTKDFDTGEWSAWQDYASGNLVVDSFDGVEFKANIKDEYAESNLHYQWWYQDRGEGTPVCLKGTSATADTFVFDNVGFSPMYGIFYVTVTNGDNESESIDSSIIPLEINGYNPIGSSYVLFIGNSALFAGESLDLSTIDSESSGIISINENGSVITLDNVNYTYDPDKEIIDTYFSQSTGLGYFLINNENTDVTFNLIGDNVIKNYYHDEESVSDGYPIMAQALGSGIINFTLHFVGDGNLTTYGGNGGIWTPYGLDIDSNLTVSKDIRPEYITRKNYGITSSNITFSSNARANFDVNGAAVDASYNDYENDSITIKPGAIINIDNKAYLPFGETRPAIIYGLKSNGPIDIEGATVNINMSADYSVYEGTGSTPYAMIAITIESDYYSSDIDIKDSTINIDMHDNPGSYSDDLSFLIRAYGIDNGNKLIGDHGVSKLNIENSDVIINAILEDTEETIGINVKDINIVDSNVTINNCGNGKNIYNYGIYTIKNAFAGEECNETFKAINSLIKVNTKAKDNNKHAVGMYVDNTDFINNDNENIEVNANGGIAILSYLEDGDINKEYDNDYVALKLDINNSKYVPNIYSIANNDLTNYSYYETLYKRNNKNIPSDYFILNIKEPDYIIPNTGIR